MTRTLRPPRRAAFLAVAMVAVAGIASFHYDSREPFCGCPA